jgi:hypothetical protein
MCAVALVYALPVLTRLGWISGLRAISGGDRSCHCPLIAWGVASPTMRGTHLALAIAMTFQLWGELWTWPQDGLALNEPDYGGVQAELEAIVPLGSPTTLDTCEAEMRRQQGGHRVWLEDAVLASQFTVIFECRPVRRPGGL